MPESIDPLARFGPATRAWFAGAFAEPTDAQSGAWDAVARGDHALVVAPTGSGKTLAAFLWAIDRLTTEPAPSRERRCRVLYVSPLKALAADVERNLRSPLAGIRQAAAREGVEVQDVTVGMRTGDTPASERRAFATRPSDVLITTPESLFLVLTSAARAGLAGVETVIVDEIHAVVGTKRGAHLAVSLERLDALLDRPAQRIGLSATVRPVEAVATFLGGHRPPAEGGRSVTVVQPPSTKRWAIDVVVPVPDLADLDAATPEPGHGSDQPGGDGPPGPDLSGAASGAPRRASVWPHVEERVVDLVAEHTSTLVFTNSRRGAERLTARMNEVWAQREGIEVAEQGATWSALLPGQSGTAAGVAGPPARPGRGLPEAVSTQPVGATVLARAHHGSMSRAERTRTESELKEGRLPAVVATSSLELGIDMGAVDLVVQVGAPPSVASGLQRIGRAGHQVGAVSKGIVFPMFRGDLVPATVIARRMRQGEIEHLHVPANPLDVLAQQVVASLALDEWEEADLLAMVRRAAPFGGLGDATWRAVLDMLAGRYPSEDFGELRARIVWDRITGLLSGRPGALRLAATSGGTIPDRGLYGVFLASEQPVSDGGASAGGDVTLGDAPAGRTRGGRRVGELDEEMVYESRVGDTFTLGSSTWRIEDITPDRVLVSPAPGLPGRLPFWKGDSPGRPAELGRAVGAFVRETDAALAADPADGRERLRAEGLDTFATENLAAYLTEQRAATGRVPDDRTVVVERFRDELGDWRVVIHSPLGARVHAPWALVIGARLRERYGVDVAAMHADDGIVLRLPDTGEGWGAPEPWDGGAGTTSAPSGSVTLEDLLLDPDEVLGAVRDELGGSVMFAARFREAAARALLLPRRRPDRRQPLWQQRHRSAQLLEVASQFPDFPIVLEAARECLQDDFDVAALSALMRDVGSGTVRVVEVTTPSPSPFAQSLLFGYTAQFLYDGDAPLAERRAAALSLDPALLAELLGDQGAADLADLLDPDAVRRTEDELQGLALDRRARDAEGLWDLLRRTGPHPVPALEARSAEPADVAGWLAGLERSRRAIRVRVAGVEQRAVAEDAGRLRDALGAALPSGIPETFTEPVPDPLGDLLRRHARTHGPFPASDVARRFGLGVAVAASALARLEAAGVLVRGRLRPDALGGVGDEWCDPGVLRVLRRRSLAALRAEVEPVEPEALGVFLPRWQGIGGSAPLRGTDGLLQVVEQLAGAAVPASALETLVLPARIADYSPAVLDELTVAGEVLWCGHARLPGSGGGDGLVSLHLADTAALTLPALEPLEEGGPLDTDLHRAVLDLLTGSGGFFLPRIAELVAAPAGEVLEALWDLVWAGWLTNDGLGALRERLGVGGGAHRAPRAPGRARPVRRSRFALSPGRPPSALGLGAGGAGAMVGRDAAGVAGAGTGPAGATVRGVVGGLRGVTLPGGGGRWSALPAREADPTLRAHALTQVLLDRHGVLTRTAAAAEGVTGGFRDVYRVLSELEERGAVRRGYFVEHLGGSQFALPGAVDRLRVDAQDRTRILELAADPTSAGHGPDDDGQPGQRSTTRGAVVLAALDPANPFGAALAWPATTSSAAPGTGTSGTGTSGTGARGTSMPSASTPGASALAQVPAGAVAATSAARATSADPWADAVSDDAAGSALAAETRSGTPTGTAPAVEGGTHRPGRKAGAVVVLVDGDLVLFIERGGRTVLSFGHPWPRVATAAAALAEAVRAGRLGKVLVQRVDGVPALEATSRAGSRDVPGPAATAAALVSAGFGVTPRGLRLRG